MSKNSVRIPWEEANKIVMRIAGIAEEQKISRKFWEVAGSYRRKCKDCGDIDLVIRKRDYGKWAFALAGIAEKGTDVLIKKKDGTVTGVLVNGTRIEIYAAEDDGFGAMLMFASGSWELNVKQRNQAIKLGMKLNEKGVYVPGEDSDIDNFRRVCFKGKHYEHLSQEEVDGKKWYKVAGQTEEECYNALEIEWISPENRSI